MSNAVRTGQLPEQITLARRWRRARTWLTVTAALHLLILALTIALLPLGPLDRAYYLVVTSVLGVGPLAGLLWLERRHPSARQPHKWPWRSVAVAFPQSMALAPLGFELLGVDVPGLWLLLFVAGVPLLPAGAAESARRSLLRPLVPELGASDVEVLVEPRVMHRPWYYTDSITLTDRDIVISVRSGSSGPTGNPKDTRLPLADVTAVGVRPALPQDSPWIALADGRGLSVPAGDVVVVHCGAATWVLPVAEAAAFAEMIRIRATNVRGFPVGTSPAVEPSEVADGPRPAAYVPEVLPAPELSGAQAYPVAGPVAPPRAGPGLTVRWALGLPLGLAGVVGVPVGLLILGGLLPAEPGLERYRLVFCLLWTGLAAGIWLRSWQQPRYWPVWALTSSFTTASLVALGGAGLRALLGPLVAVLLSWAGRRVLLRPIGVDLAASRLEIPVRGGNFRLFVQRDRLLLKMTTGAGVVPQAMPLYELTLAQPGQFAGNEVRWWPLPGSPWTRMGRGPVLRLVSGRQQWLLPVDAPRELAVIIRARVATARRPADRTLTLDQWHTLHSWASRQLTTSVGSGFTQRTVGWRLIVALPAALLGSSLLGESIARGGAFLSGGFPVVGLVELAIAVVLAADWARVRGRLRVAADNALPPGSPAWGELRSDHAPLAGWQPWWETHRS